MCVFQKKINKNKNLQSKTKTIISHAVLTELFVQTYLLTLFSFRFLNETFGFYE